MYIRAVIKCKFNFTREVISVIETIWVCFVLLSKAELSVRTFFIPKAMFPLFRIADANAKMLF